jgi:mycothione reductase
MTTQHYNTIVIGSGGGTKIAQALNTLGIRSALIEKDRAGGTCLNRGCIPSKMLIYPSGILSMLRNLRGMNIKTGATSVDFEALVASINAYTDETSDSINGNLEQTEFIDYYKGNARFLEDKVVDAGGFRLTADRMIIVTGSRPFVPAIPGLHGTPYMTSTEALRNRKLPRRLIVLGGGFIATELGGAYAGFGCDVRFVVRSKLMKNEDEDIRAEFLSEFDQGKKIHEHTRVERVAFDGSVFRVELKYQNEKTETVEAEALLVATGVIPNADQIGLEHTGITRKESGFIQVNEFLETTVPGIFAMGDVAGNFLFRHSVNFEAEYWIESNLLAAERFPIAYPPMPGAVFAHPEIASVGLTETAAIKSGVEVVIGRAPYSSCVMAAARGLKHGMVKLIFSRNDGRLVGAHIVGQEASTMIQELVLACTLGLTAPDMYRQVYIHPAFPEVVRNALRHALKQLDDRYRTLF